MSGRHINWVMSPAFGAQGITDMLALIGAYQTVCGMLSAFVVPAPDTSQAP